MIQRRTRDRPPARGAAVALVLAVIAGSPSPSRADAPDTRVAVVVGNNVGLPDETVLRYAEEDARRMHALLVEAGGVDPGRAALVLGGDARAVERAVAEAVGRADELARSGPTSVIVYVSSHADERDLHLDGTRLPIAALRDLLAGTRADLRLTIIDACQTEVLDKGGRPGPDVAVALDRGSRVEGDVLITSAGSGEAAQEWGQLSGSLFTHHLLTGLRGVADVDGDGAITLAEAYVYAYRRTAASALQGRGAQHPSFDFDMSGWGEWAFTRPDRYGATLALGPELDGRVWVVDRKQELVAEIDKIRGQTVAVGLPPGWYRVVQPAGSGAYAADVNLTFKSRRTLDAPELVRVRLRSVALKGSDPIVLRPWRVSAGYRGATGSVSGLGMEHFADLTLARDFAPFLVRLELAAGQGDARLDGGELRQQSVRLAAAAGWFLRRAWWSLELGGGLETRLGRQLLDRDDAEIVERVAGELDPDRSGAWFGPFGFVGFGVPLGDRFGVITEAQVAALAVPLVEGTELRAVVGGRAGLEWWF